MIGTRQSKYFFLNSKYLLIRYIHANLFDLAFCRIIGLYVSLVFVIGQFVRIFFIGVSSNIMFIELPNVDKVLKLLLDIYMVREARELCMEEELFSKLIFLYRSPETMIKWTKNKLS